MRSAVRITQPQMMFRVRYSKITEDLLKQEFQEKFKGIINSVFTPSNHFYQNTWGDAIFICSNGCLELAESALKLRDQIRTTNWKKIGISNELKYSASPAAGGSSAAGFSFEHPVSVTRKSIKKVESKIAKNKYIELLLIVFPCIKCFIYYQPIIIPAFLIFDYIAKRKILSINNFLCKLILKREYQIFDNASIS